MSVISLLLNLRAQVSIIKILEQIEILHDDEKAELIELIFEQVKFLTVKKEIIENLRDEIISIL